jgi:hypothetical protein
MSSSDLIRWGGLAALVSGVAWIVYGLLDLIVANPEEISPLDILLIVALLLLAVGLAGFHTLQKGNYGRIGRAGLYTAIAGCLAQALGFLYLLLDVEAGWLLAAGSLGLLVGFVLYGVATLRARVLPRWYGVVFIIFWPVAILLGDYAPIWIGLVWLALGYALWSRRGVAAEQPSRVS